MAKTFKPKKIGLALGGGGAKGLAHIGVIKALKRAGISVDYIAGTSMGAIVGGWYAATRDVEFLEDFFIKTKTKDIFPVKEMLKKKDGSLFKGESVAAALAKYFDDKKIEKCPIPFRAVATDVRNGDEVVLKSGRIADAVLASSALPAIFPPVKIGEKLLMDGGLSNPVPADIVHEMGAEFIIAVDVSSRWISSPDEAVNPKSIYDMFSAALSVVEYQLARRVLTSDDFVMRPPVLSFDWLEFGKAEEIIRIGEEEVALHLKEIRRRTGYGEPPQTLGGKFLDFLFDGGGGSGSDI